MTGGPVPEYGFKHLQLVCTGKSNFAQESFEVANGSVIWQGSIRVVRVKTNLLGRRLAIMGKSKLNNA